MCENTRSSNNTTCTTDNLAFKPKIAKAFPKIIKLEEGKIYRYCTCGHSKSFALCDDSCSSLPSGTGPHSKDFSISTFQSKGFPICQCKQTRAPPFCDGSHIQLEW